MAENRSDIIIGTKSGDTEQKLKNIAKQLKNVGTTVTDTGKKAKAAGADMEKSFKRVGDAIQAVAMGATAKMAYSLAQEAASFQEVSQYAELMANRAGMSFDRLVSASQRGANGMASSAEIMKTNLKAMRAGLKASEDDFGKLWQIADAMSDQMGVSITQAFEQITTAITTGNQKSLVSMGLLPEAYGKVSSATDLLTRRSETLKLVLEKLGPQAEEVSRQGDTTADKFTQLDNKVKDLKLHIGEQLLPVTTTLVEGLKDIAEYGIEAAKAIGWLTGGGTGVKNDVSKLGAVGVAEIKQQLINSKKAQRDDVLKLYNQATSGGLSGYDIQRVAKNYGGAGVKTNEDAITVLYSNLRALNKEIKNAETELENFKTKARMDVWVAQGKEFCDGVMTKAWNIAERLTTKTGETKDNVGKISGHTKDAAAEADKLLAKYGNLADSILPKLPETEQEAYDLLVKITAQAGGMGVAFAEATGHVREMVDELSIAAERMSDDFWSDYLTEDLMKGQWSSAGNPAMGVAAGLMGSMSGLGGYAAMSAVGEVKLDEDQTKDVTKRGWSAIRDDVGAMTVEAITSGIANSNLADAIASVAKAKSNDYLSNGLTSLLSGGAFGTVNLVGGLVTAGVSYVASNWKKWFGDKGKSETMQSNANTRQRGSNAVLNTYSAMLNPYATDSMIDQLYDTRNAASGNMVVSYKSKRAGGLRGLAGGRNYTDTTPQSTFDLIEAMEDAVEAINNYSEKKTKELELMDAQGYSYQVLSYNMEALTDTMDRVRYMQDEYTHSWNNGESTTIDLSDSIQDLKKAYYEALREYGAETGQRNTQKASAYMSLMPYLPDLYWSNNGQYIGQSELKDYIYSTQESYMNRNASEQMLKFVKWSGAGQYDLAALQYTGSGSEYLTAYLGMLQKQMEAAQLVMEEQEDIYLDMTKTFEEQSAALDMYQEAQNTYYNAKLDMLAQEQAKEEQVKREEQQAALRSAERMEALLGFTGELAQSGDKVYILQGGDTVGALKELITNYGDDPEALAALQSMLSAAQNKAKFGRI